MNNTLKVHKNTQIVGDVEVSTAIIVPTPEHDKLDKVKDESQAVGAFLDWLQHERGYTICEVDQYDHFQPVGRSITNLLAEYFEVDTKRLEAEKVALLEAIRR